MPTPESSTILPKKNSSPKPRIPGLLEKPVDAPQRQCQQCGSTDMKWSFSHAYQRYYPRCRACLRKNKTLSRLRHIEKARAKDRNYNAQHKEQRNAYYKQHRINNLERIKLRKRKHFESHREEYIVRWKLYAKAHQEQIRIRQKAYRLRNWPQILARMRDYFREHPEYRRKYKMERRSRLAGVAHTVTEAQKALALLKQKNRCAYCDKKFQRGKNKIHWDHITPVFLGGPTSITNLVASCPSCNSKKNVGPVLRPVQPLLPLGL